MKGLKFPGDSDGNLIYIDQKNCSTLHSVIALLIEDWNLFRRGMEERRNWNLLRFFLFSIGNKALKLLMLLYLMVVN